MYDEVNISLYENPTVLQPCYVSVKGFTMLKYTTDVLAVNELHN